MAKKSISLELPTALKNDIRDYGQEIAKQIAIAARDNITSKHQENIEFFYNSYDPEYYDRTWQLRKSYEKYYSNAHQKYYMGGVTISTDHMEDKHKIPDAVVVDWSIIQGYHGSPELYAPHNGESPLDMTIRYRDKMLQHIDLITGEAMTLAQRSRSYRTLNFS